MHNLLTKNGCVNVSVHHITSHGEDKQASKDLFLRNKLKLVLYIIYITTVWFLMPRRSAV